MDESILTQALEAARESIIILTKECEHWKRLYHEKCIDAAQDAAENEVLKNRYEKALQEIESLKEEVKDLVSKLSV